LALHDDPRNDQELIAAANAGDAAAFEVLYFRYRDWVGGLAFRFTGDRDLALDVLQETFLYFLRKFPGFNLTSQLKTFLYPAVRNLSIAARQKAQRAQGDTILSEVEAAAVPSGLESINEIGAVLGMLTDEHREVLLLRFVDGLTMPEIAQALEIPLGTVKSRIHNALAKLRADERTKEFFKG
jgi:RNA polymerase sigma-70 factor (ECF subfamily)